MNSKPAQLVNFGIRAAELAVLVVLYHGAAHLGMVVGRIYGDNSPFSAVSAVAIVTALAVAALVTERRWRAGRLEESEGRRQSLWRHVPDQIVEIDQDGIILSANRAWDGIDRESLVNGSIYEHVPLTAHERLRDAIERVFNSGEMVVYRSSEAGRGVSRFWIHRVVPVIRDGETASAMVIATDITEQKAAESERDHNEAQFQTLARMAPAGIFQTTPKGDCNFVNERWCHLTGMTAAESLGSGWMRLADDPGGLIEKWNTSAQQGELHFSKHRIKRTDGGVRWLACRATALRDEAGQISGYLGCVTDISDLKAAEAQLCDAIEKTEAAATVQRDFLKTLSRDVRNTISGILGTTNLLLETRLTADQRELAIAIERSGEGLLRFTRDAMDLSHLGCESFEIADDSFSVRHEVENVVAKFASTAHRKRLQLSCDVSPLVAGRQRGDAEKLRQVLSHLISNAIKFTDEGNIVVRVRTEQETDEGTQVRFEVEDTGVGIASKEIESALAPFGQTDIGKARGNGGGLGLSIAQRLVHRMNGDLGLESTPGQGTRVWFTLQFARDEKTGEETPAASADIEDSRVLVVDSDVNSRGVLIGLLESWGVEVSEAASGAEALQSLRGAAFTGHSFDLLLTNLVLPDMDGYGLAETIRNDSTLKRTRLVLVTSSTRQNGLQEADSQHDPKRSVELFDATVTTPIRAARLLESLMVNGAAAAPSTPRGAPDSSESKTGPDSRSILVAEDNMVNQELLARLLEKRGHKVHLVSDGTKAIDACATEDFDLILMDCEMPEKDGWEASRLIRAEGNSTPIIAVTANAVQGDRERCAAAGMVDFLAKPIRPELLDEILDRWLDKDAVVNIV